MKKPILIAIIALCTGLTPIIAFSDVGDVFTCDKTNAAATSAGSTVPLGGPYVPVADYAVELNTGLMVYKECVLREVVTAKRKAAAAQIDSQVLTQFNSYPSRELGAEEVALADKTVSKYLENDSLDSFNDTVESSVKQAVARGYINARDPRKSFECNYSGDLEKVYQGTPQGNYWDGFGAVADNPACTKISASVIGYDAVEHEMAYEEYKNRMRYQAGQGIYDVWHEDENGFHVTDTPGAIVLANGIQSVQSGYEQMKQADDIGEMTTGLYAGITNQVLTPSGTTGLGGLAAITEPLGGAASYMIGVVTGATNEYTTTTGNAVIGLLQAALTTERRYKAAVDSIANLFLATMTTLRDKETNCKSRITNAVCEAGSVANGTCTAISGGGTLTIRFPASANSFAQKIIDTRIRSYANAAATNGRTSQTKIDSLVQLIASLQGSPTQAAQAAAYARLTALAPHDSNAAAAQEQNLQSFQTTMATLLSDTNTAWTESTDVNTGWCNTANQATKDAWTACWSSTTATCPTP